MRKIFVIFLIIFCINSVVFAKDDIYSDDYLQECQNYMIRKERFNALYYNALQLTPEQIDKYEDIIECNKDSYQEKLNEITKEVQFYNTMKECGFTHSELVRQKQVIKQLKKELLQVSRQENKALKKILTRQQRTEYNMIKHLERHDLRKNLHQKDYHKLNPKMSVFGG